MKARAPRLSCEVEAVQVACRCKRLVELRTFDTLLLLDKTGCWLRHNSLNSRFQEKGVFSLLNS